METKPEGIIYDSKDKSFDCCADSDFLWVSMLQTQVALSMTEADYIALIMARREVVPVMELNKEMKEQGFVDMQSTPMVHWVAFKDNSKIQLQTKWLATVPLDWVDAGIFQVH